MRTYDDRYPGHLKDLDEEECRELVSQHMVGRVAWCHPTDQRPSPWVAGNRNIYVRLAVERITGRRVLPA